MSVVTICRGVIFSEHQADAIADRIRPGHRDVRTCVCGARCEVTDSRPQPDGTIRRRRECVKKCGAHGVVTRETVERTVIR